MQVCGTSLVSSVVQASFDKQLEAAKRESEERIAALKKQGLSTAETLTTPYFINISDDPALSGHLCYPLPLGKPLVVGTDSTADLVVNGVWTRPRMAEVEVLAGGVRLKVTDPEARVVINGHQVTSEKVMTDSDRVMFGKRLYKLVVPGQGGSSPKTQSPDTDYNEDLETALADSQSFKEVRTTLVSSVELRSLSPWENLSRSLARQ